MGRIQEFSIKVNGDPNHFTVSPDGQLIVSGQIILVLNEAVEVKKLKVKFLGMSHCSWTTGSGDNRRRKSSWDELWKEKREFIHSDESSPAQLSPGMHTFPFNFEIASSRHLPSSYSEHSPGRIYYELFAKMDRFGIVFDDRANLPIILYNPLRADLRGEMVPVEREEEHTDCCLCCASGPVIVFATFSKSAIRLSSDDTIDVSLSVTNMKSDSIIPRARLEEYTVFRAGSSSRNRTKKILEVEGNVIMGRTRDNRVTLRIGPVLEPVCGNIDSVSNIQVKYQIVITMKGSNFQLCHPVFVGLDKFTVPPGEAGLAAGGDLAYSNPGDFLPPPVDYNNIHLYKPEPTKMY